MKCAGSKYGGFVRTLEFESMTVKIAVGLASIGLVYAACAGYNGRNCNGHGACGQYNRCACDAGWMGVDCALRTCPVGKPWTAVASATDTARMSLVECSNMGTCDRASGLCVCRDGFVGAACQKMACPNDCSGHGTCYSMGDAAALNGATYALWDAGSVHGCVCDNGYTGYDCSQRSCLRGHDPQVAGRVNEVQAVSCKCTTCLGTFMLSWGVRSSVPIAATATAAELQTALSAITSGVSVVFDASATAVCSTAGTSAFVTFLHDFGPLPALQVAGAAATLTVSVQAGGTAALYGNQGPTVTTTKQSLECSGRGQCDYTTGQCRCALFYTSSDGQGNLGSRPDCGYRNSTLAPALPSCPAGIYEADFLATHSTAVCSGHGRCSNAPNYQCQCDKGWRGSDCSLRFCPLGKGWFDVSTSTYAARSTVVECSNAGLCNGRTGTCMCNSVFQGIACEQMTCAAACTVRGTCRSMRQISSMTSGGAVVYGSDANAAATWDADRVFGCMCNTVRYIWGQVPTYDGYDCSACTCATNPCPSGDDPWTTGQAAEVQTISCSASGGTLTLSFRGYSTAAIAYNAAPASVQSALQALPSIGRVAVVIPTGALCGATTAALTTITFLTNAGALPLLVPDSSRLTSTATVQLSVAQTTQGTTDNVLCSGRGNCASSKVRIDTTTGRCMCAKNFVHSDGQGNLGTNADCGAIDQFMSHGRL
ncbi:tenascin-like protein [Achlya hypogyna]|uniref:Tenascin-like protein n=1 Tax=Achlya hypogyna TaxID=1202772 RepID=A0A1V9ZGI6_ACHHY|nr:tenascin-like protein [Achlya hypogyna]